jgi:hypothetical protein
MKEEDMTSAQKRSASQWAAQFLAASELVRRGYTVSFTTGNNTPDADLMVRSPGDVLFLVDVKGTQGKGAWLVSSKKRNPSLFYILVYLSPLPEEAGTRKPDQFFILTQDDAAKASSKYLASHPNDSNKYPGFGWKDALPFEDKWGRLPP